MAAAKGGDVDALMYWGAGHGANNDPAALIDWIAKTTGYPTKTISSSVRCSSPGRTSPRPRRIACGGQR